MSRTAKDLAFRSVLNAAKLVASVLVRDVDVGPTRKRKINKMPGDFLVGIAGYGRSRTSRKEMPQAQ